MSLAAYTEVWGKSRSGGGKLLVLLALADQADPAGYCFPSVETIAVKARLKKRQVIRCLEELVDDAELDVWKYQINGKGPMRNGYQILVGDYAVHRGREPEALKRDQAKEVRGRKVTAAVRAAIFDRDGRCLSCGATDDLQLDHIVPWSKGGHTSAENLQVLCALCNNRKSDRTIDFRRCQNDADLVAAWVSSETPTKVSPATLPVRAVPSREPSSGTNPPIAPPDIVDLSVPPEVWLEGKRNLPLDALCQVCSVDPEGPRMTLAIIALNGRGKSVGIRQQFWIECRRFAEARHLTGELSALQANPERFARLLADRIVSKAESLRRRDTWRTSLDPKTLREQWLDVEVSRDEGALSPEQIRRAGEAA